MPRTKQQFDEIRSATKEKIIAAGLQVFAYRGLAATSIQDIASLAGISIGLMYHYYKSKEELFTDLVDMTLQAAAESTERMFNSDLSPADQISTFSKEVIDSIAENDEMSKMYLLMIHHTLAVEAPEKKLAMRAKGFAPLDHVKRSILAGQALGEVRSGDPDEMVVLYFSAIQGLAISRLTMGDRFVSPSPDLLNRLLLNPTAG